jgi:hypothetical protein
MDRFSIRMDPVWRLPLLLIGAMPSNCAVEMSDSDLQFQYGLYKTSIPFGHLVSAKRVSWALWRGIGIRLNFRGAIGLIGSTKGVVELTLSEAAVSFLGVQCDRVSVSLEDPEGFVLAIEALHQD